MIKCATTNLKYHLKLRDLDNKQNVDLKTAYTAGGTRVGDSKILKERSGVFIRKHVLRYKRLQKWVEGAIVREVGNLFQFATTRTRRHTCIRGRRLYHNRY